MRISHLLIVILIGIGMTACKSGKNSSSGNEVNENKGGNSSETAGTPPESAGNIQQTERWTREQAALGPDSFRLIVTFISIGAGTDPDAKTYLDSYILDYKTKKGKAVRYIMIPWGREGEVDCCFDLKDLTVSEQSDFIEGLRNTMKARELIQINENAKNRFKSR
ncbi:MAG: hypothetical protein IPN36_03595 [Bacteroidetes bacterium]|nr:hypothetical protein [Bacteroidota bacterium]